MKRGIQKSIPPMRHIVFSIVKINNRYNMWQGQYDQAKINYSQYNWAGFSSNSKGYQILSRKIKSSDREND